MSKSKSYAQILKENISEIIKIKDAFPKLSSNKILEIHKVIDNKGKPKLNMITKSLLCKQIIIPIGFNNVEKVMAQSNVHVTNITRSLKGIKLEVVFDFIRFDNKDSIITTNKVAAISNLNIVDKYMKNLNDID